MRIKVLPSCLQFLIYEINMWNYVNTFCVFTFPTAYELWNNKKKPLASSLSK